MNHSIRRRNLTLGAALLGCLALALLLAGVTQAQRAEGDNVLTPSLPAASELAPRQLDAWTFRACAGDVVTVTMESEAFSPFLELVDASESVLATSDLATSASDVLTETAIITDVAIDASASYTIFAGGELRTAQGDYTLLLSIVPSVTITAAELATEPVDGHLISSRTVTATLQPRRSAIWGFYGCAGDVVTLEGVSDAFDPFLEIYEAEGDEPLAEGESAEEDGAAAIKDFTLPQSGNYVLVLAGAASRDAGEYTVRFVLAPSVLGPVADATIGARRTSLFDAPDGQRAGALAARTAVRLFGRSGDGEWVFVEDDDGTRGWVLIDALVLDEDLSLPVLDPDVVAQGVGAEPTAQAPSPTPEPAADECTVVSSSLNLRSGPGTEFQPPIGALRQGDRLLMLARDPLATWANVEVIETGQEGWVSAAAEFIDCTTTVRSLPLGVIPPTPTPLPTATPTATPTRQPTATPTDAPVAQPTPPTEIVFGGGGGAGLNGNIQTDVTMISDPNGDPTFRDRIYLRMFVTDPNYGSQDGDGVSHVEFRISEEFGDYREVHFRRENSPGYCSFGGGEPNCNVLNIRSGAVWPETGIPLENGEYFAQIFVYPEDSGEGFRWSVNFFIDNPVLDGYGNDDGGDDGVEDGDGNGDTGGEVRVEIAQIGPGSTSTSVTDALAFQVEALDSGRGNDDGDGIAEVNLEIFGPDGDKVYGRTERNAAYCAFAGGEPDCNIFEFIVDESTWPGTENVVRAGPHRFFATAYAEDGRTTAVETTIQIE